MSTWGEAIVGFYNSTRQQPNITDLNIAQQALTYLGEFKSDNYDGQGQLKIDPITLSQSNKVFHVKRLLYNGSFIDGKREGKGEMYWNPKAEDGEDSNGPIDQEEDEDFNLLRSHSFSSSPFRRAKYVFHYDGQWKNDKIHG